MDELNKISKHIVATDTSRKQLAARLSDLNSHLFSDIEGKNHSFKVCGIDGGFLKKEYHGAGLI